MKFTEKPLYLILTGLLGGVFIALVSHRWLPGFDVSEDFAEAEKPLYWVAPMDPDYRRDGPGKSPMGMELVPVYAQAQGDPNNDNPGLIRISPDVVNNLGVRTVSVEEDYLQAAIKTVGYVQYDEDRLIHIHPRVKGWVEKLFVKAAGDPVRRGQPLYTLYSPELVNTQEEFLLALKRGNKTLVGAAEERLRSLQLADKIIRELRKSGRVQQHITFFAPQEGVVDNLNIREGSFVNPDTTLMSIGGLDQVWVAAEIFERHVARVKEGMPVSMTLDYLPGREWQGVVDYVYPTLDSITRTLQIRLRFNNDDGVLKPNMFAQVVIDLGSGRKRLLAPREALIRLGDQNRVVLALGEGRFKSVEVGVGQMDEESVEIISGLQTGDRVVVSAQFLLDSESSKRSDFRRIHHDTDGERGRVDRGEDSLMHEAGPKEHEHGNATGDQP
jgi:Cu(I)/Ag(I) efflux system membrane fusion protein